MDLDLGKWAVIDIETTGINPVDDAIIDVGFLQFEGLTLVRKYSSLVAYNGKLSKFIEKLTGINQKMVGNAPSMNQVKVEFQELFGHALIAHNAEFERSFLEKYFDEIDDGSDRESYEDSLYFLAILFPFFDSLKLENFIISFGVSDKELHRGFEDSLDLLKVLIISSLLVKEDQALEKQLEIMANKYRFKEDWFFKFLFQDKADLISISRQIEFDLDAALDIARKFIAEKMGEVHKQYGDKKFDLEFSGKNIKKIFGQEEILREKLPGFQYRKSQEELAIRVGQSFKNDIHSLIQAPTGTGKTIGYLVPAALFSYQEKKQILVATGTKTLQHQAMESDIPKLRTILGLAEDELKVKQLVGSGNHLCELLYRNYEQEEDLFSAPKFEELFTRFYFDMVFFYNTRLPLSKQILRGGIPYVFKRKSHEFELFEKDIAVDFRSCTGRTCPFKGNCSYINGLREAKDADIIIGNHALMFSWPKGFPRPAHVIADEAHKIEGETTKAFTLEVSKDDLSSLKKSLENLQGVGSLFYLLSQFEVNEGDSTPLINDIRDESFKIASMLGDHFEGLDQEIEIYFKKMPRYTPTFWNERPMVTVAATGLGRKIFDHFESLHFIINEYVTYLMPYRSRYEAEGMGDDDQRVMAYSRFENFMGQLDDILLALDLNIGKGEKKKNYTCSLCFHEEFSFNLKAAPIDIGKILHDSLLLSSSSVCYVSATLANGDGARGARGIEWSSGYSYLDPDRRFKGGFYLPAVYNYKENAKVFLCDDTKPLYDASFVEDTMKELTKLIRNLGGKSLLLFSARKRFEVAREILLDKFEGEIPLFIQGMGQNIVEDFKKSEHGILLGMETFGEGIDVPGEKLQFLFIDKVPDIRMDLVINERRDFYESNIGNEFSDYYLAHRARSLQQKLGRLLRREEDYGAAIVVDSRIKKWKGRTMETLVKLMEPYSIERVSLKDACDKSYDFICRNR